MSLLTPLYLAGLAAIAAPIVLHLIRRTPKGERPFSSLMFLTPSPPRLTRRSRLEHLLLLALRGLVLALVALAFCRPFLRRVARLDLGADDGRRMALVVDTSASMQRDDLWERAVERVEALLDDTRPADQVALYTFDDRLRRLVSFTEWQELPPRERRTVALERLAPVEPGWGGTDLGGALAAVADAVDAVDAVAAGSHGAPDDGAEREASTTIRPAAGMPRKVILISDLQAGADLAPLEGYAWPDDVPLAIESVVSERPTNAGLARAGDGAGDSLGPVAGDSLGPVAGHGAGDDAESEKHVRVRVTNQQDADRATFRLAWDADDGLPPVEIDVPPGESRTVRMVRPAGAETLRLEGDDHPFDNRLFFAAREQEVVRVVYLGRDEVPQGDGATGRDGGADSDDRSSAGADRPSDDDPAGLLYYMRRALGETRARRVDLAVGPERLVVPGLATRLVVVEGPPADARRDALASYLRAGGTVLWLVAGADDGPALSALAGRPIRVEEDTLQRGGPVTDVLDRDHYAILSQVDLAHGLFAPLAEPRFGDFTKIHFWRHRRLLLDDESAPAREPNGAGDDENPIRGATRIVARFDESGESDRRTGGDPAILEWRVGEQGRGRLVVCTSSWRPADSDLALSTKFVPLLEAALGLGRSGAAVRSDYRVHDELVFPAEARPATLIGSDGSRVELAAGATDMDNVAPLAAPGLYRLESEGARRPLAVNLAADESHTAPLDTAALRQRGVRLGETAAAGLTPAEKRQLRNAELESRQKLWRWLIGAALVVLLVETWLAGRTAGRARPLSLGDAT